MSLVPPGSALVVVAVLVLVLVLVAVRADDNLLSIRAGVVAPYDSPFGLNEGHARVAPQVAGEDEDEDGYADEDSP